MGSPATGRQVVMSVHPRYAEAIMDGRKKVEFRKRPLASDVSVVWVYATAPVQRIIGCFEVDATVTASPRNLWRRFASVGCIDRADFDRYYAGSSVGSGIRIGNVIRLEEPAPIRELLPSGVPPQSFAYVEPTDPSGRRAPVVAAG
ncbi:ASCH domain-containing protein [Mycolicibacterium wolinskyi]|nr:MULTISPECIES: ASCH domain-containing protein [Mycolicibacterium]MCV7288986.1 ASCH domain-containing protein [Mycolicibacterium wolinskyi]MCV7296413.1 ASCH domain-containing protein [Mycolicibacterium goodii]